MRQCTRWNFGRASRGYVREPSRSRERSRELQLARILVARATHETFHPFFLPLWSRIIRHYIIILLSRDEILDRSMDRKLLLEMLMVYPYDLIKYIVTDTNDRKGRDIFRQSLFYFHLVEQLIKAAIIIFIRDYYYNSEVVSIFNWTKVRIIKFEQEDNDFNNCIYRFIGLFFFFNGNEFCIYIKIYNQMCKIIIFTPVQFSYLSSQKYKFACDYKMLNKHEIFFL